MAASSSVRLQQLLTPALLAAGFDLEDVSVSPAGRRRVVRVVVDRDGGVDLDAVAGASRVASDVLDTAEQAEPDLLDGAYVLEVTSPGVDRPLTAARHWRRNAGRLVGATLAGGESLTGRLVSADDVQAVLEVQGATRTVLLAEVVRAQVQVEFSRPAGVRADDDDETDDADDADDADDTDETDDTDDADAMDADAADTDADGPDHQDDEQQEAR